MIDTINTILWVSGTVACVIVLGIVALAVIKRFRAPRCGEPPKPKKWTGKLWGSQDE